MKTLLVFSFVAALAVGMSSCNKTSVDPTDTDASARTTATTSSSATGPHSVTVVNAASLPTAITTYITTNYAGATIKEALKDSSGNYAVAIVQNNMLKLLVFQADGTFVKEADARKRGHRDSTHHMPGDSLHHPKGDSLHHPKPMGPIATTVAVSSLPAAITTYINTNYAGATIEKAAQDAKSSDYIVAILTSDKKHALLLFGSDGTFKKVLLGKR
ncbi:PepSY-like domain-containing protein [Spirosoma aerolatum]|uniref:PepSY-like domain-containing protein n=1 Tax=Spirosoma aerolatum TaxID=1211326 RepID=UPI0009AD63D4|nr:PepSY-like domain-containing protein [Spirosoma aerolatum]